MQRWLVAGSRYWTNRESIQRELQEGVEKHNLVAICHGGCRGADEIAGEVAKALGLAVTVYRAEWSLHGKAAGPKRNRKMLQEFKPDRVVIFHENLEGSLGSKDMARAAMSAPVSRIDVITR